MSKLLPALLVLALLAQPAVAQNQGQTSGQSQNRQTPPGGGATVVEEVVIEAQREQIREAVREFVGSATVRQGRRGQVARFDRRVCTGVVNMRADYAQYMNDRIARVADAMRLRVGEPGCQPNVLIIATDDGALLSQRLIDDNPAFFRDYADLQERGNQMLGDFTRGRPPVRWWHTAEIEIDPYGMSRLRAGTRVSLNKALIIIDTSVVGTVNFGALSDYVAMVALARLNPEADASQLDSILNLFQPGLSAEARPTGLTHWDIGYLFGIYNADRNSRGNQQEAQVIFEMLTRPSPGQRDAADTLAE